MKKTIKKLILPIILIVLFVIIYFLVFPEIKQRNASKEIFDSFRNGLTSLNIEYVEVEINAEEYGAKKAYSYTSNEKLVMLYVYGKNSKIYNQGIIDNYISSNKNEESKLYGVFLNNCVLFMESGFPNDEQVLNLFTSLSKTYYESI